MKTHETAIIRYPDGEFPIDIKCLDGDLTVEAEDDPDDVVIGYAVLDDLCSVKEGEECCHKIP